MKSTKIIGHSRQCELLRHDIQKENISHAYLFAGKKHLGKFTIAKWFAGQILTHGKEEVVQKEALHLIEKNMHPDLLTLDQLWIEGICTDWNIIARSSNVSQERRAKRKVKTNTIGIDDVRDLQFRLHETSQTGKTCCLIRSSERLNMEAAIALLKILEEPPKHVIFCFTTESPSSLPLTIVSRMRTINFSPVPRADMKTLLESFQEEDRPFLLGLAQGAPGIIMQCQEDVSRLREYKQVNIDAQRFLETHSLLERFQKISGALEKKKTSHFLQHLFLHLERQLQSEDEKKVEQAIRTSRALFSLLHTLRSNTNKQLLAMRTALQCSPS